MFFTLYCRTCKKRCEHMRLAVGNGFVYVCMTCQTPRSKAT